MKNDLSQIIKSIASERASLYISWRRHLHMHPELSFQEKETAKYIRKILTQCKVSYETDYSIQATIARLNSHPTKKISLRADIDALPIRESNKIEYASVNDGVMHACGHDVHTTCLLAAIDILQSIDVKWEGEIEAIFQPAEEKLPGGASILIEEGLFDNNSTKTITGQHVHPPLDTGKLGFCEGDYMASADEIYITIIGKGGHAATPQHNIDPVIITATILQNLQQVVARYANPLDASVLSFGKINSVGGATNVIPDEVKLEGTFRTMNEQWRYKAHELIKDIVAHTVESFGARAICDIKVGYPSLFNEVSLTRQIKTYATEYLGKSNVVTLPKRLAAEDFAFYSQKMPACFYRLGTGNDLKKTRSSVHTTTFDIDEEAIAIGAGFMAYQALRQLEDM